MESSTNSKGTDLLSVEFSGGEYMMLPAKKKKEKKKNIQVPNKPKLSKSQKRKLKKLEEEKEKELLLAESIKTLEKYKIQDDAYSLMWSSRNLGQVETVREKRRREVQFSKAGLELPHFSRRVKKRTDVANRNIEVSKDDVQLRAVDDHDHLQSPAIAEAVMHERPVPIAESIICDNEHVIPDGDDVDHSVKEAIQPLAELSKKLSSSCSHSEEIIQSTKKVDTDPESGYNGGENDKNCSSVGNFTTPTVVHVSRSEEIQKQREGLPIIMMEQEIMEAINQNISIILCGATGCGKTTQVPQFLYEAGYGSNSLKSGGGIIGVTQPRRVAVFATAKRVAKELGVRWGKEVGYQVRHDKKVAKNCSIKFMTDGILLREVQSDFLLKRYSVIILDEAHERSLNTDILIGMLSRVIQERQREYKEQQKRILSGETIDPLIRIYPLKLILMSATLRVDDFISGGRIFRNPPPVIEVPARQYPVTVHFSKRTEIVDYVGQAYKKVMSIHKRLPPGGILVFVTGQREVEYLCKKLRKASLGMVKYSAKGNDKPSPAPDENLQEENDLEETEYVHDIIDRFSMKEDQFDLSENESETSYDSEEESDLEYYSNNENQSKSTLVESEDNDMDVTSLKSAFEALTGKKASGPDTYSQEDLRTNQSSSIAVKKEKGVSVGPMRVLPLYTMLPEKAQKRVFEETKDGERLVVVATNVAETSLTIPGITYVVDSGREKVKNYNSSNGMEKFEIQWISKASAAQRTGRAGRTGPGHCYRLYSSAVFTNIFPDFSVAEILKVPADSVVLLLKSMNIGKVANFPFPTPPDTNALVEAERCLKVLEALDDKGRLTPLGKAMSRYPMTPRHSRMLLTFIQIMRKVKNYDRANLVFGYAVAAAAALCSSNPFVFQFEGSQSEEQNDSSKGEKVEDKEEKSNKKKLKQTAKISRDKFLNPTSDALSIAFALQCYELSGNKAQFCSDNALHVKTMEDMSNSRDQLLKLVFTSATEDFSWNHGTLENVEHAWRVLYSKYPLQLNEEEILGQAICAGWADRVAKRIKGPSILAEGEKRVNSARYQACNVKETVYLHRWSSLSRAPPEFLVYSELLLTKRPYVNGATSIKPNWLLQYAKSSCTFSAPLLDPKPYYDPMGDQVFSWVTPTFGPDLWQLPLHGMPIKDDFSRVAVFACSLLEGHVLPCLKGVKKFLTAVPASMLKPEGSGVKRVGNLLSKLTRRGRVIDNCVKLRMLWKEDPTELFDEIRDWFQKGFHSQFQELWAEMLREVTLDPKERFSKRVGKGKKKI